MYGNANMFSSPFLLPSFPFPPIPGIHTTPLRTVHLARATCHKLTLTLRTYLYLPQYNRAGNIVVLPAIHRSLHETDLERRLTIQAPGHNLQGSLKVLGDRKSLVAFDQIVEVVAGPGLITANQSGEVLGQAVEVGDAVWAIEIAVEVGVEVTDGIGCHD